MWGFYGGNEKKAGPYSLLIHVGVVALVLWIGSLKPVQQWRKERIMLFAPDLKPYMPRQKQAHGGGGGGTRSPLDASKGKLAEDRAEAVHSSARVITPADPKLPMTPTIVAQADSEHQRAESTAIR